MFLETYLFTYMGVFLECMSLYNVSPVDKPRWGISEEINPELYKARLWCPNHLLDGIPCVSSRP